MGKKERKSSYSENVNGEDQEMESSVSKELQKTSDWSEEDSKKLLDIVADISKNSLKNSYKVDLNKLDFKMVSKLMERKGSAKKCRRQLEILINKTKKIKSMHQVILETIEARSKNVARKGGKSAYMFYFDQNKEIIYSYAKENKINTFVAASQLWKALSEDEKLSYQDQVLEYNTVLSKQQAQTVFKDPVQSPLQLFLKKMRKKTPKITFNEAKSKYANMDISKKLKYIKRSFQTLYLKAEALQKYSEMYPNNPILKKKFYNYPSNEEIKYYYQHLGLPEIPTKSLAMFSMNKEDLLLQGVESSKLLFVANAKFGKLSKTKQREWQDKFEELWMVYFEQLEEWKLKQDHRDLELMKKWPFLTASKKNIIYNKVFEEVVMPITKSKFEDEPQIPPLNELMVYNQFLIKNGESLDKDILVRRFKDLAEDEKNNIKKSAAHLRKKYIKQLHAYVDNLTDDMRKLYLGLKRRKLMLSLKEDIFKDSYPDKQYPLYVKCLTNSNQEVAQKSKIGHKDITSPIKKSKRNLLSLESDILNMSPIRKSKLKSEEVKEELFTETSSENLKKRKDSNSSIVLTVSPQKSKKKKISESDSSDSEMKKEFTDSSPMKVKNKIALTSKKGKSSESDSSALESEKEEFITGPSHMDLKKKRASISSFTFSESPQKSSLKNISEYNSSDSDSKNITPEKSKNIEESSSEDEDITDAWHNTLSP